ncbi:hypothetical protein M9H77_18510 [Catharanthus roseus]|uniref:Uncharacterized protein n=1 Tax=Catharanthus roseus TaxID=4058 RepID=A0ACC0B7M2_CATRO|nr:hypothetical protein M9H77_18510 [Catharanthus roseus]
MDPFEDYLEENVGFEGNEDPNMFEEFLEPEEYIDHGHLFTTYRIFNLKDELVDWAKHTAMKANKYLIINPYQKSRTYDHRPYVTLAYERRGAVRKKDKTNSTNHKTTVYNHGHAQAAKLTEEQLQQTEQFRKSYVPPRNILRFFCEQNVGCAVRVWTSEVLHFGVETTNRAESEHSILKLWLSTYLGDLDTVFLNIYSLIEGQIAEIKTSLEISKLKEKYDAKSNPILKNISNNISHLALKKIWLEINRAREIVDNLQNKCGHYLRKLHDLPCAYELVGKYVHALQLQAKDTYIF